MTLNIKDYVENTIRDSGDMVILCKQRINKEQLAKHLVATLLPDVMSTATLVLPELEDTGRQIIFVIRPRVLYTESTLRNIEY